MSKVIPFALAGLGATASSVGGVYLIKGTSRTTSKGEQVPANLEFDDVSKFEGGFTSSKCVTDLFTSSVEKPGTIPDITTSSPDSNSFFKTTPSPETPFKSCLKIEYKTTKYKDDKGDGKFTGTGTFVRGDEGFINFNIAETDDKEEGNLKFSGIFYLVSKKAGETDKWEIKHKKSVENGKKSTTSNIDTYFPKASDDLKAQHKEYGGFFEDKNKLSSMCKDDNCKQSAIQSPVTKKEFSWAKGEDNSKKLDEGSKETSWGTSLYGNTPGSLSEKIKSFKGTGTPST